MNVQEQVKILHQILITKVSMCVEKLQWQAGSHKTIKVNDYIYPSNIQCKFSSEDMQHLERCFTSKETFRIYVNIFCSRNQT